MRRNERVFWKFCVRFDGEEIQEEPESVGPSCHRVSLETVKWNFATGRTALRGAAGSEHAFLALRGIGSATCSGRA